MTAVSVLKSLSVIPAKSIVFIEYCYDKIFLLRKEIPRLCRHYTKAGSRENFFYVNLDIIITKAVHAIVWVTICISTYTGKW